MIVGPTNDRTPSLADQRRELGDVTRLELTTGPLTTVQLIGDVGPVLEGTCVWPDRRGPLPRGAIRPVDLTSDAMPFGLGAATFGGPPMIATRRLGEYLLVDGESWWTPAKVPATSRREPPGARVLTPFLFRWDHMSSASAWLDSRSPVTLLAWYEYLLAELARRDAASSAAVAIEVIATTTAASIVDKCLIRAPIRQFQPSDGRLITDESHLDTYFQRNGVAHAHAPSQQCVVIMVGVAVDRGKAIATWGPDIVERGFYATPGVPEARNVVHHTHALVAPAFGPFARSDWLSSSADRIWTATGGAGVRATHLENDTMLYQAIARLGRVNRIEIV